MNRFVIIVALLLAVLWLPVVSHCDLTRLLEMKSLACCDHPETAPHEDADCQQVFCATIESGHYKVEERPVCIPPSLLLLSFLSLLLTEAPEVSLANADTPPSAPPELSRVWQFVFRTALPPRAPSLAS